jgi:hypothetical protein
MASEVALVHLDLTKQGRPIFTLLGDDLAQTLEVEHRRALVHTHQRGRCSGRGPDTKCAIRRSCTGLSNRLFRILNPS